MKTHEYSYYGYLYFWLFNDKIIFSKVSDSRIYLLGILENVLGFSLNIPYYDIDMLHKVYKVNKQINGYGFKGRKDSARSGMLYFPNGIDDSDEMAKQTDNVGKSFVSLTKVLGDINFSVYETGAIVVKKDWYSMAEYIEKLMQIRNFLKPYEKN